MSQAFEDLNRRAFLFGAMVTYAGLIVPKPRMITIPVQIGRPWMADWVPMSGYGCWPILVPPDSPLALPGIL